MKASYSWLNKAHRLAVIGAISILLLSFGVFIGVIFRQSLVVHLNGALATLNPDDELQWWWRERATQQSGVVHLQPENVAPGVTLYVSGATQTARLIDMQGKVLHDWHYPYADLATENNDEEAPPEKHAFWDAAHVYPNGDLLAVVNGSNGPLGLIKINRDSELIWFSNLRQHHTVSVAPDERIYTLTSRIRTQRIPGVDNVSPPIVEDFVTILDADGEEVRSFSVIDAFLRSPYAQYLSMARELTNGDSFHTNEAELIESGASDLVPFLKEGRLIVSLRDIHTIAVIDLEAESVVWAAKGPWFFQHDPEVLPNGNILLFDNRGDPSGHGQSRVLEINPMTQEIVWSYGGSAKRPLDSFIRSGAQRLANGNTLIVESDGGRMIEVTPGHDVVWEYLNPDRRMMDNTERISIIGLDAQRMSFNDVPFLNETVISRKRP